MGYRCSTCGGIERHDPACPILIAQDKADQKAETSQAIAGAVVFVVGIGTVVWLALF